jgi:hypothetical protein
MRRTGPLNDEQIERLARKRAGMRMGWLVHATVYVLVNLLLVTLSLASGRHWAIFPLLGWGLGLVIHGAVVLLALPGSDWRERLVQRERERLMARRSTT